jgi:nucleoside-diphosphate-sugar epimerase
MTGAPRLFCFGLGYSARVLARSLAGQGWRIAGTTRDEPSAAAEFPLHRFDRAHPLRDPSHVMAGVTHVLISAPPDATGCPVFDLHAADIAALPGLVWVGYLSTTNVYGDRGGAWVDEETPVEPSGERGRRRVAAETAWLGLSLPMHVFRLAGIYGPGRNTLVSLKAGKARRTVKPGQVFSRIHVEDLAVVLEASMAQPHPGAIYNVCDDEAAPPEEVVAYGASLLGIDPPPLEDIATATLSPMARSFFDDNKRVANRRMKEELKTVLRYPTYREGLRALLTSDG